jgi:hypothetical protein
MEGYTIGEIFRGKMLLNNKGEPYKDQASISNILKGQPYETKKTPWGDAKVFSLKTIDELNNRWK